MANRCRGWGEPRASSWVKIKGRTEKGGRAREAETREIIVVRGRVTTQAFEAIYSLHFCTRRAARHFPRSLHSMGDGVIGTPPQS
jgi:hypothetical protein